MPEQVFKNIKVADFSWVAVGPQVGRELAEHGATVVRVESHKRLDQLRLIGPWKNFDPDIDGSAFGTAFNTNKHGVSVDLSTPNGLEVARKLIAWSDVVCESMTPGSMKKLGLDYESNKKVKQDIIMFSTCMMGQYGPYSKLPGYGYIGAAMAGASQLIGWPDRPPAGAHGAYTDFVSVWFLISTLISALLYRQRTGKGLYIDMSQIEAAISFISPAILDYTVNGRVAESQGNRSPDAFPHGAFPCKGEQRWIAISISTEDEWVAFCEVIDRPDVVKNKKFDSFESRKSNEEELNQLISKVTIDFPVEELFAKLQDAGVSAGIVQNCHEDLFNDPQLQHRKHFRYLEHPIIGKHAYNAPAYILSKTPNHIHKAGPTLGEDNQYVFKEILGYSDNEIADLIVDGTITTEADL